MARNRSRWPLRVGAVAILPVLLAACVADPPPPRVVGAQGPASVPLSADALSVVVDSLDQGFNPHLRSDLGADTELLAALTLPSAYERTADGHMQRNSDLITAVTQVSEQPFTLRYDINTSAQWSDGVPIGVEDFRYMWRNVSTFPGTVGVSGYRHITNITAGAGGKSIDVTFDGEYPQWRELFANLLPAHLMGDDAQSFANVLAQGAPASGGPFTVESADMGIGQMVLARNDRYWAEAPEAEQIVIRLARDQGTLGQAARANSAKLVSVTDSETNRLVLDTVGGFETARVLGGDQLTLSWNTSAEGLEDARLRSALSNMVDAAAVGQIVSGTADTKVADFPLSGDVRAPQAPEIAEAETQLEELGYARRGGTWQKDGRPLDVTLGVVAGDEATLVAASTVVDSLRAEGVDARVWELSDENLYSGALPYGLVSGVVTWSPVTGNPLTAADGRYRCVPETAERTPSQAREEIEDLVNGDDDENASPQLAPATVTELQPPSDSASEEVGEASTTPADPEAAAEAKEEDEAKAENSDEPVISVPLPTAQSGEPVLRSARSSNLSGICDDRIDSALDTAQRGATASGLGTLGAADTAPRPNGMPVAANYPEEVGELVTQASIEVPLFLGERLIGTSPTFDGFAFPAGDTSTHPLGRELYSTAESWRTR